MAPWAEQRLLAGCWRSGEGEEVFELDREMLWWKFAGGVDFEQKLESVFVVGRSGCGE